MIHFIASSRCAFVAQAASDTARVSHGFACSLDPFSSLDSHAPQVFERAAPTLPDGAEGMLNNLRPNNNNEEDVEVDNSPQVVDAELLPERPQFVLGPEVEDEQNQMDAGN